MVSVNVNFSKMSYLGLVGGGLFKPLGCNMLISLDNAIKTATTLNSFKCTLKKLIFKNTAGRYNNRFKGKSSVNHTRIRPGLSALKYQLYTHRIVATLTCQLCNNEQDEMPLHYIFWNVQNLWPTNKISSLGCSQLWIGSTSAAHSQSLI